MRSLRSLAFLALALAAGCSTAIRSSAIRDSVGIVADRTDTYVAADDALDIAGRERAMAETSTLRQLVASRESILGTELQVAGEPVFRRHDGYVTADESLSDLERRVYIGSTRQLRALVREAIGAAVR